MERPEGNGVGRGKGRETKLFHDTFNVYTVTGSETSRVTLNPCILIDDSKLEILASCFFHPVLRLNKSVESRFQRKSIFEVSRDVKTRPPQQSSLQST